MLGWVPVEGLAGLTAAGVEGLVTAPSTLFVPTFPVTGFTFPLVLQLSAFVEFGALRV